MPLFPAKFALIPAIASPATPALLAMVGPLRTDSRIALPHSRKAGHADAAPQPLASSLSPASAPDPALASPTGPGSGLSNAEIQTGTVSVPAVTAPDWQATVLSPAFLLAALSLVLGLVLLAWLFRLHKRIRDFQEALDHHLGTARPSLDQVAHAAARVTQLEKAQAGLHNQLRQLTEAGQQTERRLTALRTSMLEDRIRGIDERFRQIVHAGQHLNHQSVSPDLLQSFHIAVDRYLPPLENLARRHPVRQERLQPLSAALRAHLQDSTIQQRLARLQPQVDLMHSSTDSLDRRFASCEVIEAEIKSLTVLTPPDAEQMPARIMDWASRELLDHDSDFAWCRSVQDLLNAFNIKPEKPAQGSQFDPGMHELIEKKNGTGLTPGLIVDVDQIGYCDQRTGDMIRKALVVVAAERL